MTRGPLERKTMKEEIDTQTFERLFILSANDKTSTEKAMQSLGVYLEQRPEVFQNDLLSNLAYTLGQRKSLHPWRIAVTASSAVDLVEALSSGKVIPCKQELEMLRMGWVFTGQGAQWWAMGRELYQQYPIYASALEKADAHLVHIGAHFSLIEELGKDEATTQVNAAYISQPSCTAVQLALVDLLRSWGLQPAAVVGHSSGEIAAAYAAGFITFGDAMTIAYHRGRLVPILKKEHPALNGCMMAVGAGEMQIRPLLDRIPLSLGQARIACINSPSSVTISGDEGAVTVLQALLETTYPGMFARKLQVDTAYHSHHMNLVAKEYTEALCGLEPPVSSKIRFYSSLLGRPASSKELDATYWVQNLTCAVRFDEAMQSMCQPISDFKTGVNLLCEIGPHAALQGPIKQILKHVGGAASKIPYASVLARKRDAVQTALTMAGILFVKGAVLNMSLVNFPKPLERPPQVLVDMPRYAWNHSSKFYHESRFTKIHKFHDAPKNDIIGVLAAYSNDLEPTWRNVVRLDDLPWLRHYQMQGVTIFPISGFLAMALEAIAQKALATETHWDSIEIENLVIKSPVMLAEEELEMTITLRPGQDDSGGSKSHEFIIRSWSQSKGWTDNCNGVIALLYMDNNEVDGLRSQRLKRQVTYSKSVEITQAATECVLSSHMYAQLAEIGVSYGASFQGLQNCHASACGSAALITTADTSVEMPHHHETNYIIHPAFVEQLISMYWPVFTAMGSLSTVHLPSSIGKATISSRALRLPRAPGSTLQAICEPKGPLVGNTSNKLSMYAVDGAGETIITVEDLSISPILELQTGTELDNIHELCYKLDWEPMSGLKEGDTKQVEQPCCDSEVVIVHGETDMQHTIASLLASRLIESFGVKTAICTVTNIAHDTTDKLYIVLTELERPLLATMSAPQFEVLKFMLTTAQGVLWMVHGSKSPDANMILGLSRALRSEGTLSKFVTLELDEGRELEPLEVVTSAFRVFLLTLDTHSTTEETEFREVNGTLVTPRIIHDHDLNGYIHNQVHPAAAEPARLCDIERPLHGSLAVPGAVESLIFDDDNRLQCPLQRNHVEIWVKAIGLNAVDSSETSAIGLECSGTITAIGSDVPNLHVGERVVAMTMQGSLSTVVRVDSRSVLSIPDNISFESAASMPIAYCTAIYALIDQARLMEGETVLIHDAASPIGQAAVTVAQMIGAHVWVTVKTEEEKMLIMQQFSISQDKIWSVGSSYFAERIRHVTQGNGLDVVLNTQTDQRTMRATWSCLAKFGRFIKIGDEQAIQLNIPHGKSATVLSADIIALAEYRPQIMHRTLADVARMLRYRQIQPLHRIKSFNASETPSALQYVAGLGPHGKSVIVLKEGDLVTVSKSASTVCTSTKVQQGYTYQETRYIPATRCNLCSHWRHGWSWP